MFSSMSSKIGKKGFSSAEFPECRVLTSVPSAEFAECWVCRAPGIPSVANAHICQSNLSPVLDAILLVIHYVNLLSTVLVHTSYS